MQTHIQKWGNSLAVRIPLKISQQLKLKAGSSVDLKIENEHLVILPQKYDLDDMLAQITDENSHHEFFEAPPKGQEEW